MVGGANYFTEFSYQEQFKFLKDLGYASISLTGLLIGLLGAAQLIPGEIEKRTILTALCRPLRRWEFIWGKYLGLLFLLSLMVGIMAVAVWGVLHWKETQLIASEGSDPAVADLIRAEARDPRMLQAVLLVGVKLAVVAAMAVFFSTIATSTTFVIAMTLLVYLIGHLQSVAREQWMESGEATRWVVKSFLVLVSLLIPDFNLYNLIDEIVAGNVVHWKSTLEVAGYSIVYIFILLGAATLAFEGRDI
jgi:ABC-type transport system involved in multi-copper enzyme maturation permease subunit